MIPKCPRFIVSELDGSASSSPCSGPAVPQGYFFRTSDSRSVRRYRCRRCRRYFSQATSSPCFGQKKRRLNVEIERLYCSGVSQRRLALILGVNRKTVVRKIRFLAARARDEQARWRRIHYAERTLSSVQFDDLETSEHSKCKPLSVALAVDPKTRRVLSFQVSRMPAKGLLKPIAFKRYGPRRDERRFGWKRMMEDLKPVVSGDATFRSDENPHYPKYLLSFA
jgi:transposase-like protein